MLEFVDAEGAIRIFRSVRGDGRVQRTRLGVVPKNRWLIRDDLKANLSEAEIVELQTIIERYREVERAQRRVDILRFPAIAREVAAYFGTEATALERRLISQALGDAIRVVRLSEKSEERADVPAKNAEQEISDSGPKAVVPAKKEETPPTGKRPWLRRGR